MDLGDVRRILVDEFQWITADEWDAEVAQFGGESQAFRDLPLFLKSFRLTDFQIQRIADPGDRGRSLSLDSGELVLIDYLDKGGAGTVFRARQREDRRDVAVKMMPLPEEGSIGEKRLNHEIRFLCDPSNRSHLYAECVVRGIRTLRTGGQIFLVMEHQQGATIHNLVRQLTERGKRVTVRQALKLTDAVLHGLRFLHDNDCIHRDIKPKNLIYSRRKGNPYFVCIVDLGIVKDLRDSVTDENTIAGTTYFMAPECYGKAREANFSSDLYGLAATLYFMLTGEPPAFAMFLKLASFPRSNKVSRDLNLWATQSPGWSRRRLDHVRSDVPEALADLVDRTLDPDPKRRPASVAEFRESFDPILKLAERVREIQEKIPAFRETFREPLAEAFKELESGPFTIRQNATTFAESVKRQNRKLIECPLPEGIKEDGSYNQKLEKFHNEIESIVARIEYQCEIATDDSQLQTALTAELERYQQLLPDLLTLQHLFSCAVNDFVGVSK